MELPTDTEVAKALFHMKDLQRQMILPLILLWVVVLLLPQLVDPDGQQHYKSMQIPVDQVDSEDLYLSKYIFLGVVDPTENQFTGV